MQDIAISVIVLSIAFTNIMHGFSIMNFITSVFAVIFVFLVHELSHRGVAKYYGFSARYVAWPFGLLLSLITSFAGFLFAAPGAVQISPYSERFAFQLRPMTKREYGIISLSGPASNLVIGFISLMLLFLYPNALLYAIATLSFWLAFFNLLPIPPLDGSKVFIWNKIVWFIAIVFAIIGWKVV